jgi:hypothetical protein
MMTTDGRKRRCNIKARGIRIAAQVIQGKRGVDDGARASEVEAAARGRGWDDGRGSIARNTVPPLFGQSSESFADIAAAAAAAGKSLAVRENHKNHVLDASTMGS